MKRLGMALVCVMLAGWLFWPGQSHAQTCTRYIDNAKSFRLYGILDNEVLCLTADFNDGYIDVVGNNTVIDGMGHTVSNFGGQLIVVRRAYSVTIRDFTYIDGVISITDNAIVYVCNVNAIILTSNGGTYQDICLLTNSFTLMPTNTPTFTPTNTPTLMPTNTPTFTPTNTPTLTPTNTPTLMPTNTPTFTPTNTPTFTPTNTPTLTPTNTPTLMPTNTPALMPTNTPTNTPTLMPTFTPTNTPTLTPTNTPTLTPTNTPTNTPTLTPTNTPTLMPIMFIVNELVYLPLIIK